MTTLDLRKALRDRGYAPVPCKGKAPTLPGWEGPTARDDYSMAHWSGPNTGMTTKLNPAADLDITDPEVAAACEETAKDWFDGRGAIPVRYGNSPKRALIFRTSVPFPKMVAAFEDPQGRRHKIEILCDGQQLIVHGTHPDTGVPYTYHGDPPWRLDSEELVEVDEPEMRALLTHLVEMVLERFPGWKLADAGNGRAGEHSTASGEDAAAPRIPTDVDALLAEAAPGDNNDRTWRATASLMRGGSSIEETVRVVMEALKRSLLANDPDRDWHALELEVWDQCFRHVKDNPELIDLIPDDMRKKRTRILAEGKHPSLRRMRHRMGPNGGWIIREDGKSHETDGSPSSPKTGKAVPPGRVRLRWFAPVDVRTLPPRRWLYGRHYQRGVVSATVAPGGTGKTSLVMVDAIAMATARNLLGDQPEERCRVWLHNGEDGQEELTRRICAICEFYKIPQEELDGWLAVTSGADMPLKVANGFSDLKIDASLVEEMTATVLDGEIDVVLLDPLVTLHSINESDNGKMDAVIRIFGRMADVCGCAVDLSHHTRKGPAGSSGDHTSDDARGASAIRDAVRMMRVLNIMSKEDASSLGLDEFSRLSYFRVDRGKANTVPPAKSATWRKFESVHLVNDDDVGVVAPWEHPDAGADTPEKVAADRKAEEMFLQLLRKYEQRNENVSSNRSGTYAPSRFAEEREAKSAKVGKVQLERAMRRLLDAGRISIGTGSRGRASKLCIPE